jgi:hypothetical protein
MLKEENTSRWEGLPWSWVERINIVKMAILPKAIYIYSTFPIKIPVSLATWEAEIGRITVEKSLGKTPSQPIAGHGCVQLSFQLSRKHK